MYFWAKSILKNNCYHTLKHPRLDECLWSDFYIMFSVASKLLLLFQHYVY
jgi:hypothetical protein